MRQGDKNTEENTGVEVKKSVVGELVSMLIYLAVILIATFLVVHFVGQRTQVSGSSMYPTLYDGDNLIVDKLSYRFKEPQRFDIIVFPYKHEDNTYYIKRIIGLPGETVRIEDGEIYINGEVLEEDYGREEIRNPGLAGDEIKLADDEYFVMGDNRNESSDSREPQVGNIKREDLIGRAFIRIWPFSRFGILKHQ